MSLGEMSGFITARTRLSPVGLLPEIRLHLADEPLHLWELTEQALGRPGLPPPFWAFAWAGGQALARYVLDHPGVVRGRRVVDIATGSGLVAIAAAMAGAASVTATDIDPFALAAVALNARANAVTVIASAGDMPAGDGTGQPGETVAPAEAATSDVALVGDAFYEKGLATRVLRLLERAHARGAAVLVGDLGRTYLPRSGFTELVAYDVPVLPTLEDADVKRTAVWRPAW
jgi:predicted nicotinamide N-methyase